MTRQEIQTLIDQIVTNANYRANQMRPLLSELLEYSSAGQTQVFDGLVANNTTSSTTLILDYGVNIIDTSTPTNYAAKLPQPVTGKKITVVNKSLMTVSLFPSNVGGQINNYPINAPAIIPPDGKAYEFICVENPLPGAWVWSPPATNQYDSGDITGTTTAINNVIVGVETGISNVTAAVFYTTGDIEGSPSINTPISTNGLAYKLNPSSAYMKPIGLGNNWNAITKIKVYTNISSASALVPTFSISGAAGVNQYLQGTDPLDYNNWLNLAPATVFTYPAASLSQVVPGVVPPAGVTANVGDPGTYYGIFDIGVDYMYPDSSSSVTTSIVGDQYIGPGTYTFGMTTYNTDNYMSLMLSGNLNPRLVATGVKYRFFLEYN
jgi:hypothetical protein